jgi:hypothetical protein
MRALSQRQTSRAVAANRFFPLLCSLMLLAGAAPADELPKEKGVARTVKMFDMFCLAQLPDIEAIERFAGFGEFAQISGADLAHYRSGAPNEKVLAWRFHDFGAELILTARRAKPDAAEKQVHPVFVNGRIVACSLLIPNDAPQADIVNELTTRMGRAPDETRDEADTHVSAWNNETPKAVGRVVFRAPADKSAKAALSASATVKD